jgi:hypothetical protein
MIIDLRDKLSYNMGHFENAINIQRDEILNKSKFDLPQTVYVYCYKGQCAEVVAEHLRKYGVNAINIGGYDTDDIITFVKTQQKVKGINKYGDLKINSRRTKDAKLIDGIEEIVDATTYLDEYPMLNRLLNFILKLLKKKVDKNNIIWYNSNRGEKNE